MTSRTTLYFSDNEDELFSRKQVSVLKQIEIFENGFVDLVEECEDSDSDSNSFASLLGTTSNENQKDLRSIKSLTAVKSKEIDFSDAEELFNRTRTKSLENDNYEDFLAIMQHFTLIPSNENGKKIFRKIREAFDEMNGLGKEGDLNSFLK